MFTLYLFNQMSLLFPFSSIMFMQKSFKFSLTVISLSYDICIAFQDQQHSTIEDNFLYAKIKSNE